MNFVSVRGEGDPNEEDGAYQRALNILYGELLDARRDDPRDSIGVGDELNARVIATYNSGFLKLSAKQCEEASVSVAK